MVAVVKTFNYTGTLQQATIPPGTTSIDVYLWAGAGGGGGSMFPGGVSVGAYASVAAGAVVTKDVTPYHLVAGNPARTFSRVDAAGRPTDTEGSI